MRRLLAVGAIALFLVLSPSCANDSGAPRTFANSDLELAVGNGARMGCSCMYVMQMPESYCRAWVLATPDVARVSFDTRAKTAAAAAFISWAAKARYVDDKRGCILE